MASSGAVDPAGGNYHNPGSNRSKHSLRSSIRDACEDTKLCSTAGASRDLCHGYPVPDRQDIARVTPVTFPAIATAMVLLSFIAKVSICALYARVFVDPKFRRKVRFVLYFFTGHFVLYLFLAALQCVPVQSVWDRTIEGRCLNLFAISYTGAAGSILEDILLIIMPIPELMKLQLGRQKKLALGFMFAVGSL
ncbi:hypothetical protein CH35J_005102 [Colletotrichum higginsianum]|uniref:Rhodopsin domain-containing protein n=1 Tax=Colletotrichum higginsianum TaxID=80884 RepID=A0A4T0W367_9PEZI|nr:hypothetical protein CH35J_005102 [Colletotrichum higginsianum]